MSDLPISETERARRARLRAEYQARINRVIDHIGAHLAEELELPALAKVANFSPYHFHRLFGALVGETLGQFIARLRAERAATQLRANPAKSITEVAFDCGFSSSATFARAFRAAFGLTPTQWRNSDRKLSKAASKYGMPDSNVGKDTIEVDVHFDPATTQLRWRVIMKQEAVSTLQADVEVRDVPTMHVAYIRHVGPYAGDGQLFGRLFGRLMAWAGPRGILGPQAQMMSLYHDDPSVTDESKLRTDCCVTVPPDTPVDGEVGKSTVPGGKYAIGHFEISSANYGAAWQAMMGGWLPESGFQPADGPCFELYLNDPQQHPEGKCVVDLYIPVKPL